MLSAPVCRDCGTALEVHWQLFDHEPVCELIEPLQVRERVARQESWRTQKAINRLEKKIHRQVQRLQAGEGGPLLAKRILQTTQRLPLWLLWGLL